PPLDDPFKTDRDIRPARKLRWPSLVAAGKQPIYQYTRDGVDRSCVGRRTENRRLTRTTQSRSRLGRRLCRDWWASAGSPPYSRSRSATRSAAAFSPATKG